MRTILAALCLCCAAPSAQSQIFIGGGAFERNLRPGYNIPGDGITNTQRYGYSTDASSFYFGRSGWRNGYLEYLDRVDRAEKFGYAVPYDSRYEFPTVVDQPAAPGETVIESAPPSTGRVFIGLGIFRRR